MRTYLIEVTTYNGELTFTGAVFSGERPSNCFIHNMNVSSLNGEIGMYSPEEKDAADKTIATLKAELRDQARQ